MLREAIRFLAGAAWNGFRCCACCPLAAGRHRGAALVGRGMVGLWLRLVGAGFLGPSRGRAVLSHSRGAGILCPMGGQAGRSFPLAGKNQRATGGSQSETAPWLPPDPSPLGLGAEPHVTRGYSLPRGGGLERIWGVMHVVRWRPGGTGGPPLLRAGWWALVAPKERGCLCNSRNRHGADYPAPGMAGGAGVASVGLRRRTPPLSTEAERATLREAGRPQGSPARAHA